MGEICSVPDCHFDTTSKLKRPGSRLGRSRAPQRRLYVIETVVDIVVVSYVPEIVSPKTLST